MEFSSDIFFGILFLDIISISWKKKKQTKKNQAYFGGLNLFDADEIVKEEVKLIRHEDLPCIMLLRLPLYIRLAIQFKNRCLHKQ